MASLFLLISLQRQNSLRNSADFDQSPVKVVGGWPRRAPFEKAGGGAAVTVAVAWDGAVGALVEADIVGTWVVGAAAAAAIACSWMGCVGCVVRGWGPDNVAMVLSPCEIVCRSAGLVRDGATGAFPFDVVRRMGWLAGCYSS